MGTSPIRTSASPEAKLSGVAAGCLLVGSFLTATGGSDEHRVRLAGHEIPGFCPVHRITGHRCPGCGMTRAVALMMRGRIRAAIGLNPFSPGVLIALIVLAARPLLGNVLPQPRSGPA
jgi:Protein of unknown function (DUF2752)